VLVHSRGLSITFETAPFAHSDSDGLELRVVGTRRALTSCLCTAFSASRGAALLVLVLGSSDVGARVAAPFVEEEHPHRSFLAVVRTG
jgi:hypothetical protein